MSARQNRVPAGVSTGGRFTVSQHAEPKVTLDAQAHDLRPRRVAAELDPAEAFEVREQGRSVGAARTASGRAGKPVVVTASQPDTLR